MEEIKLESKELSSFEFRVAKMSAIETLALRSIISFDTFDKAVKSYSYILEHIEVKCGDNWLKVKQGNDFYPVDIENNPIAMEELAYEFTTKFLKKVFLKSNA